MLTIRLLRTGKKNQPSYKVVVTDRHNPPKGGKFVEEVGFYNPKTKEKKFNKDRIVYWLSVGAQASDTIHNMLVGEKVIDEPKRKIIFTKKEVAASPEPVAESPEPVEGTESPVVENSEPVEEPVEGKEVKPEEPVIEPTPAVSPEPVAVSPVVAASPEPVEGNPAE